MPVTYTFDTAAEADRAIEVIAAMSPPGVVGRKYRVARVDDLRVTVSL